MNIPRTTLNSEKIKTSVISLIGLREKAIKRDLHLFHKKDSPQFSQDKLDQHSDPENAFIKALMLNDIGFWEFEIEENRLCLCPIAEGISDSINAIAKSKQSNLGINDCIFRLSVLKRIKRKLLKSEKFEEEFEIIGERYSKWITITATLFFYGTNKMKVIGTIKDISHKVETRVKTKDMIALLSHELRTPLTTLKLYVQGALRPGNLNLLSDTARMLEKADLQINKMNILIEDFLSTSIPDNPINHLNKEVLNLTDLIREVTDNFAFLHTDNTFRISLTDNLFIRGDAEKLKQVLSNYLSNAVKYSAENSFIVIGVKKTPRSADVWVKDQGVGISEKNLKLLFQRFSRVDRKRLEHIKGNGLGLFISKQIIEQHGGRVWAESQENLGSVFYFSVPSEPAHVS